MHCCQSPCVADRRLTTDCRHFQHAPVAQAIPLGSMGEAHSFDIEQGAPKSLALSLADAN